MTTTTPTSSSTTNSTATAAAATTASSQQLAGNFNTFLTLLTTQLQNQQPQLERALEQAGLKTADNGLQFTLRDQSFAGQNGGSGGGAQPSPAQLVIPDAEAPVIQATQIYSRAGLGSGVDIRV